MYTVDNSPEDTSLRTPHVSVPVPVRTDVSAWRIKVRIDFADKFHIRYDADYN